MSPILVSLLSACVIGGLFRWLAILIPLPTPSRVILASIFVLWLIFLLLPLTGAHYPVLR